MKFTSRDRDNDVLSGYNCAIWHGGFWYSSCGGLEINDDYNDPSMLHLNNKWHSVTHLEMKIRPQNCNVASYVA